MENINDVTLETILKVIDSKKEFDYISKAINFMEKVFLLYEFSAFKVFSFSQVWRAPGSALMEARILL